MEPRHGTDRDLPPGQVETRKFPVVGERSGIGPVDDLSAWRLVVEGTVRRPVELDWGGFRALPERRRRVDIHCVTRWSRVGVTLTGTPVADVLDLAGPLPGARFVRFEAYSDRRHDTSLPLSVACQDAWLVHAIDDRPLTPEHGYPLRVVTPSRYFYKSLKWVHRIELMEDDRPGYWERTSSYHPRGDPWAGDERFSSGGLSPHRLASLRRGNVGPFIGGASIAIGVDLRGFEPSRTDLRRLQVKNSDLRRARLRGVDLRDANLSLCDLRESDLRGADLRGADLEGADFRGADLRGADLRGALLSASRFAPADGEASGAAVEGMRIGGASGLLEREGSYLEQQGATS